MSTTFCEVVWFVLLENHKVFCLQDRVGTKYYKHTKQQTKERESELRYNLCAKHGGPIACSCGHSKQSTCTVRQGGEFGTVLKNV